MPRSEAGFIPHPYCTETSGACFINSKCLSNCTAYRKKNHEARIKELERRLAQLERQFYRAKGHD